MLFSSEFSAMTALYVRKTNFKKTDCTCGQISLSWNHPFEPLRIHRISKKKVQSGSFRIRIAIQFITKPEHF